MTFSIDLLNEKEWMGEDSYLELDGFIHVARFPLEGRAVKSSLSPAPVLGNWRFFSVSCSLSVLLWPWCSVAWSYDPRGLFFVTPWTVAHQAPLRMEFSRQEYRSVLPFLLQGIFFPTQGWNPRDSLPLSYLGSPFYGQPSTIALTCLFLLATTLLPYRPKT